MDAHVTLNIPAPCDSIDYRPARGQFQGIEGSRRVHPGARAIRFGAAPYTLCVEGSGQGCVCAHGCTSGVGVAALLRSRDTWSHAQFWTRQKATNRPNRRPVASFTTQEWLS